MRQVKTRTDNSQFENCQINCRNTAAYDKTQILVLIILFHLHPSSVCDAFSIGEIGPCVHHDRTWLRSAAGGGKVEGSFWGTSESRSVCHTAREETPLLFVHMDSSSCSKDGAFFPFTEL